MLPTDRSGFNRGGAVGDDGAIRGVAVENAVDDSAIRGVAVENAVEDSAIRGVAVEIAVEDGADAIDSDAATYQYQATFARMSEDPRKHRSSHSAKFVGSEVPIKLPRG